MAYIPPKFFQPYSGTNFNQAQGAYQNAQQYAMPSAASRDTAAARVRNRLSGQTAANVQRVNDTYANRGMLNSGARDRAVRDTYNSGDNALASGLTDLELGFSQQQQEGANILGNLAQGMTQNESARQQAQNQYNQLQSEYYMGQQDIDLQHLLGQGKLDNEMFGLQSNNALQGQQNMTDLIQALGLYGLTNTTANSDWALNQFNPLFQGLITQLGGMAPAPMPSAPSRNIPFSQLLNKKQVSPRY